MDKITHQMRLSQWTTRIRDCRSSGMTVKAWCSHNDIGEKQFYYWQHRVRQAAFGELQESSVQEPPSFVALPVPTLLNATTTASEPVLVVRTKTYSVEIHSQVPEALLHCVLQVISHVE